MSEELTVVVCYKGGTSELMATWFASMWRHTNDVRFRTKVLTKKGDLDSGLACLVLCYPEVSVEEVDVGDDALSTSRIHGVMLDSYVPGKVETRYVMTMDSDCFPVADGWVSELTGMLENGARISGILHPWAPPSVDMKKSKIEWRVRSQHCWERTHVACQMMRTQDLKELCSSGMKFAGGDDTGLLVPKMALEKGWRIDGYKPTRCPKPEVGKVDPEFNRYVGILYGDKVCHMGGYTRVSVCGDEPVFEEEFGWARKRVLKERGAEFLLDDLLSYKFKLDREEEVAAEKMQRLFGMREQGKVL